ncbi:hypothetical protein G1H11_11605 [Phytoactinopolyspora alkaliphila]|uniref:Uncharacterized protein n=1 Tax=Phytoactinopolyspora alkaliphila TaxID=1783498 RepID=A0A6N9YLW2_9ACTN|nr:hypothetical protein [Phytoactinopolyspora alkaliphila]NED95955.1 hypothetical protein [Phytoactinopolyspora alkaliphila]
MGDETAAAQQNRATADTELLGIYLNDHLAGATAGVRLAYRIARSHQGPGDGQTLLRLADDISDDRAQLLSIMNALGISVSRYKAQLAAALEWVGRVKLNGSLLTRSPLSSLDEIEALRLGVEGKRALWRSLREVAKVDDRLDADHLTELEERARAQIDTLERLRLETAAAVLATRSPK